MKTLLLLLVIGAPLQAQTFIGGTPATREKLTQLLRVSTPYAPPDIYHAWWDETLAICECPTNAQLTDLQWRGIIGSGLYERGEYWTRIDVVFVLNDDRMSAKVIKHEMLHAMLGGDTEHQHPAWQRLKRST